MATTSGATVPVTFTYRSSTASKVEVAGNWDSWSGRIALAKVPDVQEEGQDLWQVDHQVAPSTKIAYKYILNGDDWHARDDLPTETDANGNKNNFILSPEAGHATSDEQEGRTTGEVVGAGITGAVGAAIASVVGSDPFEGEKKEVAPDANATAVSTGQSSNSVGNAAAEPSAATSSIPAGAAPAQPPSDQFAKLGFSDDKASSNSASTAAPAAAVAAAGVGAATAGSTVAASQQHNSAGARESTDPAVVNPSSTFSAPKTEGVLNQKDASRGLDVGASGSAPSVGATVTDGQQTAAADKAKEVGASVAGAGAAAAGVAAATAASVATQAKETVAPSEKKVSETTSQGVPAQGSAPKAAEKNDVSPNGVGAAATTAAAGGTTAAVAQRGEHPSEVVQKQEGLSSGPSAAQSGTQPGLSAGNGKSKPQESAPPPADVKAALAGGSTAGSAETKQASSLTETSAKQEKISSGPHATGTTAAGVAPALVNLPGAPSNHAAHPAAANTAAPMGSSTPAPQVAKDDKQTAVPNANATSNTVGAGTAAATTTAQPSTPTPSAPTTPSKADRGSKRGSRFGTSRKSKGTPDASELGEANSSSSTTFPSSGGAGNSSLSTGEQKTLERSRKKSGFFSKIKEKLGGGSPSKNAN